MSVSFEILLSIEYQTMEERSNVDALSALTATPFSVAIAVISSAGVTSKLGL